MGAIHLIMCLTAAIHFATFALTMDIHNRRSLLALVVGLVTLVVVLLSQYFEYQKEIRSYQKTMMDLESDRKKMAAAREDFEALKMDIAQKWKWMKDQSGPAHDWEWFFNADDLASFEANFPAWASSSGVKVGHFNILAPQVASNSTRFLKRTIILKLSGDAAGLKDLYGRRDELKRVMKWAPPKPPADKNEMTLHLEVLIWSTENYHQRAEDRTPAKSWPVRPRICRMDTSDSDVWLWPYSAYVRQRQDDLQNVCREFDKSPDRDKQYNEMEMKNMILAEQIKAMNIILQQPGVLAPPPSDDSAPASKEPAGAKE
jgi:hypothetical protein